MWVEITMDNIHQYSCNKPFVYRKTWKIVKTYFVTDNISIVEALFEQMQNDIWLKANCWLHTVMKMLLLYNNKRYLPDRWRLTCEKKIAFLKIKVDRFSTIPVSTDYLLFDCWKQ